MQYKESDLVLEVSKSVDPKVWDEGFYQNFLDILFGEREYQKEATETTLRYMNSGEYKNLEELAYVNFSKNSVIKERFNNNFLAMKKDLDFIDKLAGTIDLATGTGKTYVMIALALIMLASKKVTRVLILVPSLTIESEVTQKFRDVMANEQLIKSLGAEFVTPQLLNGHSTLVENSITIENRDAIYKAQKNRNSIVDSLKGQGQQTLVLNDEVHHVYYSETNQWKEFISDSNDYGIDFKYIIGLTGTAYKSKTKSGDANDYLSDVIYRYSLRSAIEENFVKDVEYISKEDMPSDKKERWQVILNSHDNISKFSQKTLGEKPITIIVTSRQNRSDSQSKSFKKFLQEERNLSKNEVDNIVLSVHSGSSAAIDRLRLKEVDQPNNPVEFIFSVSMLTEGWDVKRVFQIVPDEERAFNSKLLISQVMGRGLRRPNGWKAEWGSPVVTIFNHEKWAPKVKSLVDEVLELKKKITIGINQDSNYHFTLNNVKYKSTPKSSETFKMGSYNLWIETDENNNPLLNENGKATIVGVKLPTDKKTAKTNITMSKLNEENGRELEISYDHEVISIDEMAHILYYRFDDIGDEERAKEYKDIWPVSRIKNMIEISLQNSNNNVITKNIKNIFLSSMNVIFRQNTKSVTYEVEPDVFFERHTSELHRETNDLNNFLFNKTLFYTEDFESNIEDDHSKESYKELVNTANGYKHVKIENKYNFKTPQYAIATSGRPEMLFLNKLTEGEITSSYDSFVKSADMNFYDIEYTWRKGSHHKSAKYNPDWFIKQGDLIIVVETKDDSQINDPDPENIGKNKASIKHFEVLNQQLKESGKNLRYKFTFLSPKDFDIFFDSLKKGELKKFNSKLDIALTKQ